MTDAIAIIISEVAKAHLMTPEELLRPTHKRRVVRPRQIAMAIARELYQPAEHLTKGSGWGGSLPALGRRFGNRHHTTILWAEGRIARLRADNPTFARAYENLKDHCRRKIAEHAEALAAITAPLRAAAELRDAERFASLGL